MAEIEVKVIDRVAPSIATNLKAVATAAQAADAAVKKLQSQLVAMNAGALNVIMQASANTTRALLQTASAQQQLNTAQARTATAAAQAAAAQARVTTATTQGAIATQKLATEQARTATQTAQAAAASDRAALAALRLSQAQDKAAKASKSAADTMLSYVRAAAAVAGVSFGANAILDAADAYATLQNKLQNVTSSQEQVNTLTERMFNLANETRTSVESTATAFARFDRALALMGKSQEDSLQMTETINKALIVSGASAQETSSALLQLSQAFNGGRLNGDEFRAVSENMPMVLDAIAKALGKPVNQLKQLSAQGKITSEVMFNAFKAVAGSVDEKFAKTVSTIGQALEVASNKATKFLGEMGISAVVAGAILTLADNLKELAVAATAVGTAMLFAFGPQIVAAIGAATTAVKAFTITLAANPVGLLAVVLATVISYLVLFRDEITVGTDKLTTFGDVMRAVIEKAKDYWNVFTIFIGKVFDEVTLIAKNAMPRLANEMVSGITDAINSVIEVINKGLAALGKEKIELIDFKATKEEGKLEMVEMGELWAKSLQEGMDKENRSISLMGRAQEIGDERRKGANAKLREKGVSQLGGNIDPTVAKAVERRATALNKINTELDNQINRMYTLQKEREAQAKFDAIEESLISKKIELTGGPGGEIETIKAKIAIIQDGIEVQQEMDALYQQSVGPLERYNAQVKAANLLLERKNISQKEHDLALRKSSEEYLNSIDPLRKWILEIEQELELLKLLPEEREIERKVIQATNEALKENKEINKDLLRQGLIIQMQKDKARAHELNAIDATIYARKDELDQLAAIARLMKSGELGFDKNDAYQALKETETGSFLIASTEMMESEYQRLEQFYNNIKQLRNEDWMSAEAYHSAIVSIWNRQNDIRLNSAKGFFGAFEGLMRSHNRRAFAIGKAAAVANALISAYQSAAGAYAAMVGIKYVGPVLAPIAATAALAAGMVNVMAIRNQNMSGFAEGGYTGNAPANEVAGAVHGKEFVMNAEATKRIGVANLQALQDGAKAVNRNTTPAQPVGMSASSLNNTVHIRNINVLDPTLVGDYMSSPQGEQVFINMLRRNSEQVRQIAQNG